MMNNRVDLRKAKKLCRVFVHSFSSTTANVFNIDLAYAEHTWDFFFLFLENYLRVPNKDVHFHFDVFSLQIKSGRVLHVTHACCEYAVKCKYLQRIYYISNTICAKQSISVLQLRTSLNIFSVLSIDAKLNYFDSILRN